MARAHLAESRIAQASDLIGESTRTLDEMVKQNADVALFRQKAAEAWYVRALVAGAALQAKTPPPSRQRLVDDALSSLEKAKARGFFQDSSNLAGLRTEPLFSPLQKDERFRRFLRDVSSPR
jgi:hypothetical protein